MSTRNPGRPARRPIELAVTRAVALRVVAARNRLGWTQHRLAFALTATNVPLTRGAIASLEAGANPNGPARAVTVDELCALAAALGTTPNALLHGAECGVCHDAPPKGFLCKACGADDDPFRRAPADAKAAV
jgi:transcriptional regulator with XRE-family HTH domain